MSQQEELLKKIEKHLDTIEFLLGALFMIAIFAVAGAIFNAIGIIKLL